jgi:hypothetical protein
MLNKGKIMKEHAKIIKKELTEMGLYPKMRVYNQKGWERIDLKVFYSRFMADVDMDWVFTVLHNLGYHKEIWFTFLPSKAGVWLHIIVSASRWGEL